MPAFRGQVWVRRKQKVSTAPRTAAAARRLGTRSPVSGPHTQEAQPPCICSPSAWPEAAVYSSLLQDQACTKLHMQHPNLPLTRSSAAAGRSTPAQLAQRAGQVPFSHRSLGPLEPIGLRPHTVSAAHGHLSCYLLLESCPGFVGTCIGTASSGTFWALAGGHRTIAAPPPPPPPPRYVLCLNGHKQPNVWEGELES